MRELRSFQGGKSGEGRTDLGCVGRLEFVVLGHCGCGECCGSLSDMILGISCVLWLSLLLEKSNETKLAKRIDAHGIEE